MQAATAQLEKISDTPRLDAEVLLAQATGKTRTYFRAWPEKQLTAAEQSLFQTRLAERLHGRPIAHIVGSREFWSRDFWVTADTLIPRPDTELLVELALARVAPDAVAHIADLGTGSGAVAVTLALELPQAHVTALDISLAALNVAERNAAHWGAKTIRFVQSDWFAALPTGERFDLIVSNPPYIAAADPHLSQGDLRFEPLAALASGADGLDAIRRIVSAAPAWLKPGSWLLFEHGWDQAAAARGLLAAAGFVQVESFVDLQGHGWVSGGRRPAAPA
ncbi:MAG: peptide chain release factor N(5)-glutamine methyltransferase [Candidatus Methylumidiphilus sp.]